MMDVGRLCVKTAGREAGKICCIVKKIDAQFVEVTGPVMLTQVKRRKCNIHHLEPLPEQVKIAANASDEDVAKAMQAAGVMEKFRLKMPTAEELKARAARKEERVKSAAAHAEKAKEKKAADAKKVAEKKAAKAPKAKAPKAPKAEVKAEAKPAAVKEEKK